MVHQWWFPATSLNYAPLNHDYGRKGEPIILCLSSLFNVIEWLHLNHWLLVTSPGANEVTLPQHGTHHSEMLRISSLGIWGVTIHKRGNNDLKLSQGHCCNGPAVQDWLQGFGSLLLMLWLWKELHSYLDQPVVVQLQVPSHVLVSKNPVVSWWDVPNSESVYRCFFGSIRYKSKYVKRHPNGVRWGSGGPLVYWRHHWNNLGAGHLGPFRWMLKAKMLGDDDDDDWQETRKISFFTARLASFSITQDLFLQNSECHAYWFRAKNSFRQRSGILTCLTSTGTWGVSFFWRKASAVERWKDCQPQAAFSHWDSDRIDSLCVNLFGAGYAIAWYDPFWWIQQRQPQGLVMTW